MVVSDLVPQSNAHFSQEIRPNYIVQEQAFSNRSPDFNLVKHQNYYYFMVEKLQNVDLTQATMNPFVIKVSGYIKIMGQVLYTCVITKAKPTGVFVCVYCG